MAKAQASEPEQSLVGLFSQRYEQGKSYMRQAGYFSAWPLYERFRAGDQWPAPTARTKSLPRPVFNMIKLIETHKVSNVMAEQINMVFSPQEMEEQEVPEGEIAVGELFTRLSAATWERLDQDDMNEEALEIGANTGTMIAHYYWDTEIKGGTKFPYVGEMEGEVLDPINVFFGNPQQRNVQKQPYILITSRDEVFNVRSYAKNNGVSKEMTKQIKADKDVQDEGYDRAKDEVDSADGKVTVITCYWRKDGQIYFAKIASGVLICPERSIGHRRYPIAVMQWDRRRKAIHGVGETEALIPNQRAINTLIAMQILSVHLTGFPKMLYKSGSVDPMKITNQPGEMIEDRSLPGQGDGIKYLQPGAISTVAGPLVDTIIGHTRSMSGADDAATGTAPSADMNATAIALLQKASAVPIESIKRRYRKWIQDIGLIWEEFWKIKYNLPRQVTLKDDDGEEFAAEFTGSDYADQELRLKIDVGPSSTYSESLVLASLNDAMSRGDLSYKQFLKFAPKNVVPFRDRLLKDMEEQSGIVGMIEQFVESLPPEMQQQFQGLDPAQQFQFIMVGMQQQLAPQMPAQPGAPPGAVAPTDAMSASSVPSPIAEPQII